MLTVVSFGNKEGHMLKMQKCCYEHLEHLENPKLPTNNGF